MTTGSRLARVLLLVAVSAAQLATGLAATQRAIPDDNLAYPVLITLRNGATGSGFYINTGQAIYLVTAKHVLFDLNTQNLLDATADILSYPADPSNSGRNFGTLDLSLLQRDGNIKPHQSEDIVVVKISTSLNNSIMDTKAEAKGTSALVRGVEFKEFAKDGLVCAHLDIIKPFEQVLTGNDVIVFGYPTSLGLQQLPQIDLHRPLLRKGIVAGTNSLKRSIILDCPSYFGNSGGPVLELDKVGFETHLYFIGVVREYVPFADAGRANTFMLLSNSGYSIATPMDFVLELVK
jgi:hypothetical protein